MSIEKRFDIPLVAAMALKEKQIQQNYRPIIAVHKWFARRPGTLFRGLVLSEFGDRPLSESGDVLESAIEAALGAAGISFRKTKRAERVAGFDQAPDFIIPSEFNPQVIIEAKITEDDGTARDKVTRVQHLGALSMQGRGAGERPRFEVIACIAGRGFKVRREDMRKLLFATRGKVFTLENLDRLVTCSRLSEFRSR